MKKILFTAVSALAIGAAVAADSTQFGVLKVPSSAKQTIVSVPWLASGTGSGSVKVADLVLTAGLTEGDELRLYANGKMSQSWRLNADKEWEGGTNVSGDDQKSQSGNDQTTIDRGQALMLVRSKPSEPAYFYIMGKPAASEEGSTTMLSGTAAAPAYTLIAPSRTKDTNVGDLTFTGLQSAQDYLILGDGDVPRPLTYVSGDNKGWYNPRTKQYNDVSIPAGKGAWFMSKSSGEKSVSWGN